jgi:hypothetical protein
VSRRETVDNAIWGDPQFERLSPHAKLLYLWSFTNPRCGMAGVYKLSRRQAALETGLTVDEVTAALQTLVDARFLVYEDDVVWVRTRVKRLATKTPQIARSIAKDIGVLAPGHPVRVAFLEEHALIDWLEEHLSVIAPEGGWQAAVGVTERRRREVIDRDGRCCLACGATRRLTIDHITPVSRGGDNSVENLQTLCLPCNARKGVSVIDYRSQRGSSQRGSLAEESQQTSSSYTPSKEGQSKTLMRQGQGQGKEGGPGETGNGRSRRVDPSQLPDGFPDDLLPAVAAVLPVLRRVHGMRGGTEPTRRGVALAVQRFPDRDHAAVAGELEQWATAGNGTRRNVKDWSGTFASFLGRSPACEPRTAGGAAVGDELEQHRRRVAAAQRRREEFERGRDRALSPDGAA